jgi:sodium-coupled neutral amino acid transporter 11
MLRKCSIHAVSFATSTQKFVAVMSFASYRGMSASLGLASKSIRDSMSGNSKAGIAVSIAMLSATTLGSGLLALPVSFSFVGYVVALVLLAAGALASHFSINLLLDLALYSNATTYEQLGRAAFPKFGKQLVGLFTFLIIFGGLVSFIDVIGDTLAPIANQFHGAPSKDLLKVLVAVPVILPLCLLKDISMLEKTSAFAVIIIIFFSGVVVVTGIISLSNETGYVNGEWEHPPHPAIWDTSNTLFGLPKGLFESFPIISLAYTCHFTVFPIWANLKGATRKESLVNMRKVSLGLVVLCFTLCRYCACSYNYSGLVFVCLCCLSSALASHTASSYFFSRLTDAVVGLFGYLQFTINTDSNLISNYPDKEVFYSIVRGLFTVAITFHYPIVHFALRQSIEEVFFADYKPSVVRRCVITVLNVGGTLALAIAVPKITNVFGIFGAVGAFPICYILPALFFFKLRRDGPAKIVVDSEAEKVYQQMLDEQLIDVVDENDVEKNVDVEKDSSPASTSNAKKTTATKSMNHTSSIHRSLEPHMFNNGHGPFFVGVLLVVSFVVAVMSAYVVIKDVVDPDPKAVTVVLGSGSASASPAATQLSLSASVAKSALSSLSASMSPSA